MRTALMYAFLQRLPRYIAVSVSTILLHPESQASFVNLGAYSKDATAGYSKELTDVASELVWPLFASVWSVTEWSDTLESKRV